MCVMITTSLSSFYVLSYTGDNPLTLFGIYSHTSFLLFSPKAFCHRWGYSLLVLHDVKIAVQRMSITYFAVRLGFIFTSTYLCIVIYNYVI